MYLTNKNFEAIEKALRLLPHGKEFDQLDKENQDIIVNAEVVMVELLKKKNASNEKTAKYIADKRKINKNYARSNKKTQTE